MMSTCFRHFRNVSDSLISGIREIDWFSGRTVLFYYFSQSCFENSKNSIG
jgi:hypothetical protein